MDYVNYCIELRKDGHDTNYILNQLKNKGIPDNEAKQHLRNAESLFLVHQGKKDANQNFKKLFRTFNYLALLSILALMILSFTGYIQLGIIPLVIILVALQSGKTIHKHKQKFQR